ncbi:hypothetical protein SAMN04488029_4050 [Reichenbachiella faecimaris]|uniref:Uncharacterized protein n=1 Tax=Reichenbachiella faecimaris TaxID=692418 RepID=A0A1W2GRD0_REIFA|nr:hypothetical protein [Reichenbachiella faecimaris]SMD39114.1 hypothetical protein SAMN04488029_4050 [Reichenbachiella faecimaris]
MRKNFARTSVLSCLLLASSCHIDELGKEKLGTYSPHIVLNLGAAEYTVLELLEDLDQESLEVNDEDQTMSILFRDSTLFSDNESLIAISSVSNVEEFAPGEDVPSTPVDYEIEIEETFVFSFPANNGEEIDSVFYNSGTLDFFMESSFEGDIDYTWVIEGTRITETNLDLTQSKELTYTGSTVTDTYSRSLNGLKSLFYKNALDENEFAVHVTGTISFETGSQILSTDKMIFNLAFNNPAFSKVYGFFGNDPLDLQSQTIDISAFDEFSGDGLKLEDPRVLLITKNSFGLDFELSFDEIKAVAADNSEVLFVENPSSGIDGFVSSPEVEGEIKRDTIELNKENSNINELLNSTPVLMDFSISGIPNPASSTLDNNFMLEESEIEVVSVIDIPLQFQMDGFSVDFDFEMDLSDIEKADRIAFSIVATNEIPFAGTIDLHFVDEEENTLYTLLDAVGIDSPDVGSGGRSIEPEVSSSEIDLDTEGIDALLHAHKILATVNLSTFEAEVDRYVTLYADYVLKIELSLAGEVTIEL